MYVLYCWTVVFLCLNFCVCGLIKWCSVTISVRCNHEETLRLGWGCCTEGRVSYVVVSVDRGCPIICAPLESNRILLGMLGTSPSHSSANNNDQELLTRFVYNGCGMKLFGLCVMALGISDMDVWKVWHKPGEKHLITASHCKHTATWLTARRMKTLWYTNNSRIYLDKCIFTKQLQAQKVSQLNWHFSGKGIIVQVKHNIRLTWKL